MNDLALVLLTLWTILVFFIVLFTVIGFPPYGKDESHRSVMFVNQGQRRKLCLQPGCRRMSDGKKWIRLSKSVFEEMEALAMAKLIVGDGDYVQ